MNVLTSPWVTKKKGKKRTPVMKWMRIGGRLQRVYSTSYTTPDIYEIVDLIPSTPRRKNFRRNFDPVRPRNFIGIIDEEYYKLREMHRKFEEIDQEVEFSYLNHAGTLTSIKLN